MCFRNPLNRETYSLPQKDFDSDEESPTKKPGFVAIQMIELENELEQNCTLEIIHKLSNLYSQAMEFFDDQEDPKCFDIQKRLHRMLKRPEVVQLLNNPISPSNLKSFALAQDKKEDKKEDFENRKKEISAEFCKTLEEDKQNNSASVELLGKETEKAQEVATRIFSSFSKQEEALFDRVNKRKNSMKSKDLSFCALVEKSDACAGFRGDMQTEVEEFLESNYAQQSSAISEINVRYQTEINKLDGQGGVMAMVVEQMRKNQEDEVHSVRDKFELIRRERVSIIMKKYLEDSS